MSANMGRILGVMGYVEMILGGICDTLVLVFVSCEK